MKRKHSVLLGWAAFVGAVMVPLQSWAAYPDRPITIVVPYPPGGPADLVARPLSVGLQKTLGVPIVLQYKPGAGGQIALRYARRADNDGYTLVLVLAAYAIGPLLKRTPDYDPANDFEPVSLIAKQPLVLYASTNSPLNSTADLIARARAYPGTVAIASSGYGNTSHLAVELLSQAAGVQLTHVPYHGGIQSISAVISGDVDAAFAGSDSLRYVAEGKIRALAVAARNRLAISPGTPTFAESGLPDMSVDGWYGLLAPKGTTPHRINKLTRAVQNAVGTASFHEALSRYGFTLSYEGPDSFRSFIRQEFMRWGKLTRAKGLATD